MATEITLAAAIRDAQHSNPKIRQKAIRNLAPAFLEEHGLPKPSWTTDLIESSESSSSGQLPLVHQLLLETCDDSPPDIQAWAMIGLGQLGVPELLDLGEKVLELGPRSEIQGDESEENDSSDPAKVFLRESTVIALSFLGSAAQTQTENQTAQSCFQKTTQLLLSCLKSPREEIRFQAATSLAELGGPIAEEGLAASIQSETNSEVLENIIRAISMFDPPSKNSCEELIRGLEGTKHFSHAARFEAAMALAAARRVEALPHLLPFLKIKESQDRALEAMAVFGSVPDLSDIKKQTVLSEILATLRELLSKWRTPGLTKVRAAYAFASLAPEEGLPILKSYQNSLRPSIRGAALEAGELLRQAGVTSD